MQMCCSVHHCHHYVWCGARIVGPASSRACQSLLQLFSSYVLTLISSVDRIASDSHVSWAEMKAVCKCSVPVLHREVMFLWQLKFVNLKGGMDDLF